TTVPRSESSVLQVKNSPERGQACPVVRTKTSRPTFSILVNAITWSRKTTALYATDRWISGWTRILEIITCVKTLNVPSAESRPAFQTTRCNDISFLTLRQLADGANADLRQESGS